jgi:hypothetical protein
MKRILLGATLALMIGLTVSGLAWADFGVSNFRMSDQPGGPKMAQFPKDITTVYVMFDYQDANDMPIQIRVYDPRGQVIFQETKNYNGSGSETMTVQLSEGVSLPEGDYVTNVFTRQELYLTESLEWTVGQPSSQPPAAETPIIVQVPNQQQPGSTTPAGSSTGSSGGVNLPILGAGVLFVALIGLVVWAVRGFVTASR